jgi:hypothetical protein
LGCGRSAFGSLGQIRRKRGTSPAQDVNGGKCPVDVSDNCEMLDPSKRAA